MAAKKAKKAKKADKAQNGHSMEVEVFDDEGKPTGETRVVEANPDALKAYAKVHKISAKGIKDVPGLVDKVLAGIRKAKKGEDTYECLVCNTGLPAGDGDTFCPYCGGDMTEDDTGGIEVWLKANKKVTVVDKTEDESACECPSEDETGDKEYTEPEAVSEPAADDESEVVVIDPEAESDERSLDERRNNIIQIAVRLDQQSGEAAYDLGQELYRIKEAELYDEGGFDTFRDFCEAPRDKGGLGMSYANATNYIRLFSSPSITRELAASHGYSKMEVMANLLDDPRTAKKAAKLIEPAKDGTAPISNLSVKAVKDRAKNIRADARTQIATGKDAGKGGGPKGRKPASMYEKAGLLDVSVTRVVVLDPGPGEETFIGLDHKVGIDVIFKQRKDKKYQVTIRGVLAETDEE